MAAAYQSCVAARMSTGMRFGRATLMKEESMTDIDLYLDPVCPFAWVTSRWLLAAAQTTDTPVTLRQMSLAVLNEGSDVDAQHKSMMNQSRRLGRLFAAVTDRYGPDAFAGLYNSLGTLIHEQREEITSSVISEALVEDGFDGSLAGAADNQELDPGVKSAHDASQKALGDEAGSPIIAIDGRSFFGPVLTEVPTSQDGVALLHAVLTAARIPGFAVLQRPHQGPPNIAGARER
jgi:hypothetical protein